MAVITIACPCIIESPHALAQAAAEETAEHDAGQILLVVGAAGTDQYGQQFEAWAKQWDSIAAKSKTPLRSIGRGAASETNDRDRLARQIRAAATGGPAPLWIVMIGHGTFARGVAKFNLRGPDVSATELAQWLDPLERTVVIVNCASSSGPFINRLSKPNRIVVTATKSGNEQNYARFGEYFSLAMASPDSDLDHDDEVSVHEAFLRASAEVRQFYQTASRIVTEHALLDDNGDGKGTPASMFRGTRQAATAKDGAKLDGLVALRVTLAPTEVQLPLTPGERKERSAIEDQLDQLRARKSQLDEESYDAQLLPLMLRLATIYQAAERRAEGEPSD